MMKNIISQALKAAALAVAFQIKAGSGVAALVEERARLRRLSAEMQAVHRESVTRTQG